MADILPMTSHAGFCERQSIGKPIGKPVVRLAASVSVARRAPANPDATKAMVTYSRRPVPRLTPGPNSLVRLAEQPDRCVKAADARLDR
jgi:hypothetical protein